MNRIAQPLLQLLAVLFVALAMPVAPALADRAPPPPTTTTAPAVDDNQRAIETQNEAACLGKAARVLCDTAKGEPGTCMGVRNTSGVAVLQCVATANQEPTEQGPMVMLLFGIIVAIVGGFLWWRLKKNFHKT